MDYRDKMSINDKNLTRRDFLSVAMTVPILLSGLGVSASAKDGVSVASPNGQIGFFLDSKSPLSYRVTLNNRPVVEPSRIGIVIDGADLGSGAEIKKIEVYRANEKYAWRGVHSEAVDRFRGARIRATHPTSKTDFAIDVRVFNDGVAFRYVVPGNSEVRVPDEATVFTLPANSTSWFHDFYGHYEGIHQRKKIEDVKEGEWAAPPVTFELPDGSGYVAITEAALVNYPGMGLRADGHRRFRAVLGNALPVSHPYELRYSKADIERLSKPATFIGDIQTPWRVVLVSPDLNGLVNSDIIHNLSSPPDRTLFPDGNATAWLRPGRAVWRYLDGGENTLEGMKEFSRLAGELGFEHNIVEGFWRQWSEDQMRELVDYSAKVKVGIWFWEHSRNLKTDDERRVFFERLNRVGVVGAKIDFFDHEAKEVIDQYHALLHSAAEHKIMLEFHGSNKPTGESRTWPNEMTRESIRGMEYRSMEQRAVHNTTLPFTRFLAGHADYTPVHFGERRRETSWTHQIATAAVFTSPLMIYGAHPKSLLENPAVDMIKSIPSTWDETIVLEPSRIGELAAFARRKGDTWFLAILNGPNAKTVKMPLSFLGRGTYDAMLVRDKLDDAAAVAIERSNPARGDSLNIEMRVGGGFIARFVPAASLAKERKA